MILLLEVGEVKNEERATFVALSLLLGYPDSNQERQDQNLQCYHYTIAQCFGVKLACFSFPSAKVLLFFETANFYRIFLLKKVKKW